MLRLSEEENRRVIEFHEIHEQAKGRGFGRVFRSPTLFEDMVKCILLCNCQWSRTLSMALALCELQAELQHPLPGESNIKDEPGTTLSFEATNIKPFAPKTPSGKESKRKPRQCLPKLAKKIAESLGGEETEIEISTSVISECYDKTNHLSPTFTPETQEARGGFLEKCNPSATSADDSDHRFSDVTENYDSSTIGNFNSPFQSRGERKSGKRADFEDLFNLCILRHVKGIWRN